MLTKTSKLRILEAFYGLDYTFFGKPVSKVDYCCPVMVEDYLSTKAALLSTLIEIFKLIEPKKSKVLETNQITEQQLVQLARVSSKVARENALVIMKDPRSVRDVKILVQESLRTKKGKKTPVEKIVESKVRQKTFSVAVDNLLIARHLPGSKGMDKLNEWSGRIVEDAYKILRDNLVEVAALILETDESVE